MANEFILDYIDRIRDITKDCRADMHEPDEQGLTVKFHEGLAFDNAFTHEPVDGDDLLSRTDTGFWIIKDEGEPTERREWFNLACLIAVVRSGPWRG